MHIEEPYYAFELPSGFELRTRESEDAPFSAFREADGIEVTVRSLRASDEAPVDELLRYLADKRCEALRAKGAAERIASLEIVDRLDVRIASFYAAGDNPALTFSAELTPREPIGGHRYVSNLSLYRYRPMGGGAVDLDAFLRIARLILATFEPVPHRATLTRPESEAVAIERLYPYLVPESYLAYRAAEAPPAPCVGHGLYLFVAEDHDGVVRVRAPAELASLGEPSFVIARAKANLARAASKQEIPMARVEGPRGWPMVIFGPDWRAASCLLLPSLHGAVAHHLGTEEICATVPHRDRMLLFRRGDRAYRDEVRALVAQNEADARKPLTPALFTVSAAGAEPLAE